MPRSIPQRSCLGCREVKNKQDLLRFVLDPERALVPDVLAKLPGRGAYTCWREGCVRTAVARRQFSRAFHGEVAVGGADDLVKRLAALMEERIAGYLALANKAGKVVSGADMVTEMCRKRTPGILFLAADTSAEGGGRITRLAGAGNIPLVTFFDMNRLGALIGKESRSVVAVEEGGISESIKRELIRYQSFF